MTPPPIGAARYRDLLLARRAAAPGIATGAAVSRGALRWAGSGLATLVSTYLLDLVATACGLLLVVTGVPDAVGVPVLWWVLAASYVVWGLGLRVNLRANLALLDRSGVSTNVLSKAAHDLATRRTTSPRARRAAAASGYVLSELLKELPYYLGAFGAAAVSDGLGPAEAITFLVGANLGAGLYECGLAAATRVVLRHRPRATFERDFDPRAYLREYYTTVEPDEVATIAFLTAAVERAPRARPVLLYGVGPTLHHAFLAAPVASELHLGELLARNRDEITRWLDRDPTAHDWRPFVRHTLRCEGIADPDDRQVAEREDLTRAKVTRLFHVDARHPPPVPEQYSLVVSAYCADSATGDREEWATFMGAIMAHVAPGGLFATAALHRSRGYRVGGRSFPSADVDESDLRRLLEGAWGAGGADVRVHPLTGQPDHGYSGVLLATAVRPATPAPSPSATRATTAAGQERRSALS